jgi:hypothetical protein
VTIKTYTPEELKAILELHRKWWYGEAGGQQANLRSANLGGADLGGANLGGANLGGANLRSADLGGADLGGADLGGANLRSADLGGANLGGADLGGANLRSADLRSADLRSANLGGADLGGADLGGADLGGANLRSANLGGARLTFGETWEKYLEEVVPALLTAGGKTVADIVAAGAWECHDWGNCPMHAAFGIDHSSEGPILLRPRIEEFVRLFDAQLIPLPKVEGK